MTRYKATDRAAIRLFWQAGLGHKKLLLLSLLHPAGAVLISMVAPFFVGKILAAMAIPGGHPTDYLPYFIGAAVLGLLCNRFGFTALLRHQAKTMSDLQSQALEALLHRGIGFHNNNVGGKLVSDAIDFPNAYSQLANAMLINFIPFTIVLTSGIVIVFTASWQLGLLVLLMAVFAIGSGIYESRKRSPLRKERLKATKAVTGHLADTILNVQTVKTFAHESVELAHNNTLNERLRDMRLRDWTSASIAGSRRIAVLMGLQVVFVIVTSKLVEQDPSLLAVGIFAFSFTITLSNRLFEVNALLRTAEDGLLQASPMTEIILEDSEIKDKPGAKPLKATKGEIALKNVGFSYEDSVNKQKVFSGLNLTIKPGERIGLVGPSGGGKSTLTRLLLRFEDITNGEIAIDNQNITDVTQASLRQHIAYVPQEPLLFHRSIRENIAYGHPDATDEDVELAAKMAHAHEFIKDLPDGYETIVGERGVKLSGGQRQRIAIARAILKNAPVLILDEATSALDSESEVLIQEALWKLMEGRTAIVIAHRLSTIQKMDRILVLDKGTITEQGTHQQLLQNKGTYAKLWAHQSGGFLQD